MFEETVPNTNGDMVCMTALKSGPAFSNARAREAGAEVSGTMAKEKREDGCGEVGGCLVSFCLRSFGNTDVG